MTHRTFATFVLVLAAAAGLPAQGFLFSLSPSSVQEGSPGFTMVLTGLGFPSTSVVQWDGANVATTFIGVTQLQVDVTAAMVATAGTHTIRVRQTATSSNFSNSQTFSVTNPLPSLTSISPSSVTAGGGSFFLTAIGSDFTPQSVIRWNGTDLPTIYIASIGVASNIPASVIASGGVASITVFSPAPGGGLTSPLVLTINNPVPTLTSITPASAPAGVPLSLAVTGSSFNATSIVRLDGTDLPTTFNATGSLTASVAASLIASGGLRSVTVRNPSPAGGTSAAASLTIVNPVPAVSSVAPASIPVGSGATAITITGSNFVSTSVARADTTLLVTTFVSTSQVTATIPASLLLAAGVRAIAVGNAAPGGGLSGSVPLAVTNPAPTIIGFGPSSVPAGSPDTTLAISGASFVASSQVKLGGTPIATTFNGPTSLSAVIPASLLASGSISAVSVENAAPGGGVSVGGNFIVSNPVPSIAALSPAVVPGGSADVTVALIGSGFVPETLILLSGTPVSSTFVSSTQVTFVLTSGLSSASRPWTVAAANALPGGGIDTFVLKVDGPVIASVAPTTMAPAIAMAFGVTGDGFDGTSQIHVNGAPRPTTVVSTTFLTCLLPANDPATQQLGGFALTVTRTGPALPVVSNAIGVTVGAVGNPDNIGTVSLAPRAPAPGDAFGIRVESPFFTTPVTLIADPAAPPTSILNIAPGFDLAVGPGLGAPIVLADGVGLFGPPSSAALAVYSLSVFGLPGNRGVFQVNGLVAPSPALGITVSLVAIYGHGPSPIGLTSTHVSGPYAF